VMKSEIRMTKVETIPNDKTRIEAGRPPAFSSFGLRHSFGFRHSSFVIPPL